MPEEQNQTGECPDLYQQNIVNIQMAHLVAVQNYHTPHGFVGFMGDLDSVFSRGLLKHLWQEYKPPEQIDIELDAHVQALKEDNQPPLGITAIPRHILHGFMRNLVMQEHMIQQQANRGASIIARMEKQPKPGHFYTLLVARVSGNQDEFSMLLVETPE